MKIHEREESASDEQTAAIDFKLKLQTTPGTPASASGESLLSFATFEPYNSSSDAETSVRGNLRGHDLSTMLKAY